MELVTRQTESPAVGPVEIVERKGLGHPDTLCDAIAERVCVALCRHYLARFGMILHHNVDKVLLCGGASRPRFGGGEVVAPIEIYLAGRATRAWKGVDVPVDQLATAACREVLAERIPLLDRDRELRIVSRIRPGSRDLTELFARPGVPRANDTSCGVGFAPLTTLERLVLDAERSLHSPELGADIKVMGVRRGGERDLTIACAFVDRHVESLDDYVAKKAAARARITGAANVALNTADDVARGDIYLTVTGTSAEAGDDGEVGRGNRVGGLITPYRAMTLEAAAGKNPVSHVGKLYSIVAHRVAARLVEQVAGVAGATCVMVSQIGRPIDDPWIVELAIGGDVDAARRAARDLVRGELANLEAVRADLLAGSVTLF